MISEPDQAILNKLAESAGQTPKVSEAELDDLPLEELDEVSARKAKESPRWIFVITPTEERHRDWWTMGMMIYFRDGLSVANLSNGRLAFCTWVVK